MEVFALIMAGGTGRRMENEIPKQFLEINDKPIILHTIDAFRIFNPEIHIIVVIPSDHEGYWNRIAAKYSSLNSKVAFGGTERFFSVKNGLDIIGQDGIVFIHDAVRPLVSQATLRRCFDCAVKIGNAIPVIPVSESLRKSDGSRNWAVDRTGLFLVQTPQTFRISQIKNAYQQDYKPEFTDDASVLESMGEQIHLVKGNPDNIKITYPEDTKLAGALLNII